MGWVLIYLAATYVGTYGCVRLLHALCERFPDDLWQPGESFTTCLRYVVLFAPVLWWVLALVLAGVGLVGAVLVVTNAAAWAVDRCRPLFDRLGI